MIGRIITKFEILDTKANMALQTFEMTDLANVVRSVHGDSLNHLSVQISIGVWPSWPIEMM